MDIFVNSQPQQAGRWFLSGSPCEKSVQTAKGAIRCNSGNRRTESQIVETVLTCILVAVKICHGIVPDLREETWFSFI